MPLPPDLVWQLETVRLSLFLEILTPSMGEDWWENIVGVAPEQSTVKRATGEHMDAGPFENSQLTLGRQMLAKRVDWILHPRQFLSDELLGIGEFLNTQEKFVDLMNRWLEQSEIRVVRVAYGATLLAPVGDVSTGYSILHSALPMIKFQDDWTDFNFQVNKKIFLPELSETPLAAFPVNCLTKWGVISFGYISIEQSSVLQPLQTAARVELDLNTDAENKKVLDKTQVNVIFKSLVGLAKSYSKEGFLS